MEILHHLSSLYHSATHLHHTYRSAADELAFDMDSRPVFPRATDTVAALRAQLPRALAAPRVAIVCGSGLGGLADALNPPAEEGTEGPGSGGGGTEAEGGGAGKVEWAYADVPGFPVSTVPGHAGKLIFGTMSPARVPVVLLVGRAHFYEGYPMELVTFATRVCKLLDVQTMLLTNAAGALNQDYNVGDIVCLNDHLNLAGLVGFHPLRGPNEEEFGVRFPPLSDAYDMSLRQLAHQSWQDIRRESPSDRKMHEGVYAFVAGPTYETRAECRMLRNLGADVVGMSTVPEIVVARHSGMRVLAFSLVTNKSVLDPTVRADNPELAGMTREQLDEFMSRGRANHEEVLEAGRLAAIDMQGLVLRIVSKL